MKNYSEVLNHVVYEYRPFANKINDSIEAYNDELNELYKEFDNFSYKFEKLDKKRAIHYNYLLQDLETYIKNIQRSAEDVVSERFVTMNQIDARNDISTSFTFDSIDDSTKIPEIMPEITVDFDIRDYLESDQILITMQSQEYAITKVEIKYGGKILASPNERITVFKYNKKVYLVHDSNNLLKIPLKPSDLIFKPEYVRYIAKVQGFENFDERQVIVVNSGDVCECLDEFGNIK
ncbi:hypothetical protein TVAG_345970 [Trichomonas vaginalis G3]|uniref:Uncharacterized protein n=1 Tax=Trichomonas vaginalis (strain ATCC PRA-98 / G3) TaxID=412133 RepID=A2F4Y4_TRIV3|nr:uncharacterized protein TVAGG3_1070080 [Trichomonas vaginalis G3]EAY00049.1 hypothetical protein TVAG_345970 [Trichomonas vaginalis G3]KAI5483116.1 hypothetical protein TVAGG3_1070080 [Trichomonas vaginalis G3]|eukprot:XP_001312978.1 hypothetical protein [Trichomonas vaginalis G3]